jgi:hypothetical protein
MKPKRATVSIIGHQPRTHAAIVGLDQADHHPVLVRHGHIDGVVAAIDGQRRVGQRRLAHIDIRALFRGAFL